MGNKQVDQRLVHVVDDDHQVRAATSFLLRSLGYRSEVYADGREFLDQAALSEGCVLLDLRMPNLGGFEVLEELRRRGAALPVIMLSGHGDIPIAVQAMKLGAREFLEKPYEESALIEAVERAMGDNQSSRERDEQIHLASTNVAALSLRERQVLQALLGGLSNKAIARRLDLSPRTVEMHRANMMSRLKATSLAEAVRVALDAGVEPLDIDAESVRLFAS